MTAISIPNAGRAHAVWWKDIERWNVRSVRGPLWHWPRSHIKPLSKALERIHEPIDKSATSIRTARFITIRFTGEIEERDLRGKDNFKGNLFAARAGDLVYSKIDVRNGAIGIVPHKFPLVAVTSEFPVYRIRREIAVPEYIQLVFRTSYFRAIINGMVSGASGRKRVQPEELERVEIPVPPLDVQQAIVGRWRSAQEKIATEQERAETCTKEAEAQFLDELGLKVTKRTSNPKAFGIWWKNLRRWGVDFNYLVISAADLTRGYFPVMELGSLVDLIQYGTSNKANDRKDGIAVVRMNNIVDGQLDLRDLKHVRLGVQDVQRLILRDGDILFNRTNSKELVGKCAVFHATEAYVFASYLIRVRANPEKIDPDFLAYVINSPIGRHQIGALSRQIIGQANINTQELRALQIPVPPLRVQSSMMKRISNARSQIAKGRMTAAGLLDAVNNEIEALILGSATSIEM